MAKPGTVKFELKVKKQHLVRTLCCYDAMGGALNVNNMCSRIG